MSFTVEIAPTGEADLERLFDFLIDRAETTEALDRAQAAIDAIRATVRHRLAITPYSFRKAAQPRRPPKLPHLWPPKLLHLAGVS